MKAKLLLALPLLLGLNLGLSGCQDRVEAADPTGLSAQEGGKVSFRLSSAEIATLGSGFDSVRIEAVREGFATQISAGSLTQSVVLNNLSAGGWTLRVALYDADQAIHYYGEALVQILPGRTVDAEIHLRKATGSVRVRIILDPDPNVPGLDTLTVLYGSQSPSWTPLKAWRTQAGVYMISTLLSPCEWPVLTFEEIPMVLIVRASARAQLDRITPVPFIDQSRWILGKGIDTGRACVELYQEHTHFVPWTASGAVTLLTPTGEIFLPDPNGPPPSDTGHVTISPTTGSKPGFLAILAAQRDDSAVRILTQYYCQAPVVRILPDSGIRWVFGSDPDIAMKCAEGSPKPMVVTVPKSICGTIQLENANGMRQYLPGKACVDPIPVSSPDTVLVKAEDGIMLSRSFGSRDGLPVEKVWRDGSSIWVYTRFDCNIQPRALYNIHMEIGVAADPNGDSLVVTTMPAPSTIQMTLIRPQNATEIGCAELPHLVRIPFGPEKDVLFRSLVDGRSFFLQGSTVPVVVDSSFQQYSSMTSDGSGFGFDYVLFANGTVQRTPSHGMVTVDTVVIPAKAVIPPDSVAMIAKLLETARIRHPEGACVVAEPAITRVADSLVTGLKFLPSPEAYTRTRRVDYANGTVSAQRWNTSLNCVPPKSWSALDAVDDMLAASFDRI